MAYARLGNYLLASPLSTDPLGGIHRGLSTLGASLENNHLIRTFSQEIQDAGLSGKGEEVERAIGSLSGARGLGTGYRFEAAEPSHLAWDYLPGRSLAQLIAKTRQEQIPLGIDHALSITQGISQALLQMHSRGLSHGVLSPHSIWVSFEGAIQLADAPVAPALCSLLGQCPSLAGMLARYRPAKAATPFQIDLFALGAMFYELLTLEQLPSQGQIPEALAQATLKAAQDEAPLPAEIRDFLGRLLMAGSPFDSAGELTSALESVLYDGDYSPTTFNMAFFMHTLFREENEQESLALKEDQGRDFSEYLPVPTGAGAAPAVGSKALPRWIAIGSTAAVLVVGGLVYANHRSSSRAAALQAQLDELKDAEAKAEAQRVALQQLEERQQQIEQELQRKLQEEKKTKDREELQKKLDETRRKREELDEKRRAAREKQDELRRRREQLAAQGKTQPPPAAAPAPAPTPQPTPAPAPAPAPATASSSQARMVNAVPARFPQAALRLGAASHDRAVTVKIFVDSQGRPQKTMVQSGVGGSYGFDEAALEAARASSYAPASQNCRPVPGWVTKTYSFPAQRTGAAAASSSDASSECQMISVAPVKLSYASRKYLTEDRSVTVKVYVDSTGRPQKVIVVKGVPDSGIDEAVRDSALASSYKPGVRDGRPVAGWVSKTYTLAKQ